jgi:hypothetical protein
VLCPENEGAMHTLFFLRKRQKRKNKNFCLDLTCSGTKKSPVELRMVTLKKKDELAGIVFFDEKLVDEIHH